MLLIRYTIGDMQNLREAYRGVQKPLTVLTRLLVVAALGITSCAPSTTDVNFRMLNCGDTTQRNGTIDITGAYGKNISVGGANMSVTKDGLEIKPGGTVRPLGLNQATIDSGTTILTATVGSPITTTSSFRIEGSCK